MTASQNFVSTSSLLTPSLHCAWAASNEFLTFPLTASSASLQVITSSSNSAILSSSALLAAEFCPKPMAKQAHYTSHTMCTRCIEKMKQYVHYKRPSKLELQCMHRRRWSHVGLLENCSPVSEQIVESMMTLPSILAPFKLKSLRATL